MKRTTVMLAEEDWIGLKQLAQRQGRSPSEMIREAVAAYVTDRTEEGSPAFVGVGSSGRENVSRQPERYLGRA